MEADEYRLIVGETIEALPAKLRDRMKDVVVVIEERPQRGYRRRLLGLYEGVPITEWGKGAAVAELPDQITLFTRMIEAVAETEEEVPHVVRETLWHEIAHHFGFDHDAMHDMEAKWRRKRERGA
jgi:predicted Zn-dependent protease with MMP-like domain